MKVTVACAQYGIGEPADFAAFVDRVAGQVGIAADWPAQQRPDLERPIVEAL